VLVGGLGLVLFRSYLVLFVVGFVSRCLVGFVGVYIVVDLVVVGG